MHSRLSSKAKQKSLTPIFKVLFSDKKTVETRVQKLVLYLSLNKFVHFSNMKKLFVMCKVDVRINPLNKFQPLMSRCKFWGLIHELVYFGHFVPGSGLFNLIPGI